jgi:hypothetical protein
VQPTGQTAGTSSTDASSSCPSVRHAAALPLALSQTVLTEWPCGHWRLCVWPTVEILLTIIFAGSGVKLSFLRILRMLRIARMLRLMKAWKGLYQIVMTVVRATPQMGNVLVLMFLINLIFALFGMQIFGAQVRATPSAATPPSQLSVADLLPHTRNGSSVVVGRIVSVLCTSSTLLTGTNRSLVSTFL